VQRCSITLYLGERSLACGRTAQFGGSALYIGLRVGGMERVASYPATLWTVIVGVMAVTGVQVSA
jgi:hypothetical protein